MHAAAASRSCSGDDLCCCGVAVWTAAAQKSGYVLDRFEFNDSQRSATLKRLLAVCETCNHCSRPARAHLHSPLARGCTRAACYQHTAVRGPRAPSSGGVALLSAAGRPLVPTQIPWALAWRRKWYVDQLGDASCLQWPRRRCSRGGRTASCGRPTSGWSCASSWLRPPCSCSSGHAPPIAFAPPSRLLFSPAYISTPSVSSPLLARTACATACGYFLPFIYCFLTGPTEGAYVPFHDLCGMILSGARAGRGEKVH